jgi:stage II sporulation protein AA (anti-sigma F factor antagonist)
MTDATLRVERRDGGVVLDLSGEIDLANVDVLREQINAEVENTSWALVLDVTRLDYLDSAGVRLMFELSSKLAEHRQELIVVAPPGSTPRDVLDLVSLDRAARVIGTRDEALERVRALRREQSRT